MKLHVQPQSVDWWLWLVTGVMLALGLLGWRGGFGGAVVLGLVQVAYCTGRYGSLTTFATQVRLAYLLLAVLFWFDPTRLLYLLLFIETVMVVLLDRSAITQALKRAPWNQDRTA